MDAEDYRDAEIWQNDAKPSQLSPESPPQRGDLVRPESREKAENDREAVPLAVPVVGDYREQPLPFDLRKNLGLLHPEYLIQSGYQTEIIIFSDVGEVDLKVRPKVSAVSSGNPRKCDFP